MSEVNRKLYLIFCNFIKKYFKKSNNICNKKYLKRIPIQNSVLDKKRHTYISVSLILI